MLGHLEALNLDRYRIAEAVPHLHFYDLCGGQQALQLHLTLIDCFLMAHALLNDAREIGFHLSGKEASVAHTVNEARYRIIHAFSPIPPLTAMSGRHPLNCLPLTFTDVQKNSWQGLSQSNSHFGHHSTHFHDTLVPDTPFLPLSSSLLHLASCFASAASSVVARGSTIARRLCRILRTSALAAANEELALRRPRLLLADRSRDRPMLDVFLDDLLCLSCGRPRRRLIGTAAETVRPYASLAR